MLAALAFAIAMPSGPIFQPSLSTTPIVRKDETVTLARKLEKGHEYKYTVQLAMDMPGQAFEMNMAVTLKCLGEEDGKFPVEGSIVQSGSASGQKISDQDAKKFKTFALKQGLFLDVKDVSEGGETTILAVLGAIPDKPLTVGQPTTYKAKVKEGQKEQELTFNVKLLEVVDMGGKRAAKLAVSFDIPDQSGAKMEMTSWVSVEDGLVIKVEGSASGGPNGQAFKIKMNRA